MHFCESHTDEHRKTQEELRKFVFIKQNMGPHSKPWETVEMETIKCH